MASDLSIATARATAPLRPEAGRATPDARRPARRGSPFTLLLPPRHGAQVLAKSAVGPGAVDEATAPYHAIYIPFAATRFHLRLAGRAHDVTGATGEVCVVPQGMPNAWSWPSLSASMAIQIEDATLRRVLGDAVGSRGLDIRPSPAVADPDFLRLGRKILQELEQPDLGSASLIDSLLVAVAVRLLRGHSAADRRPQRRYTIAPWRLKRVVERAEAGLDEDLGLEDLASFSGLSVAHFARAFRASMGEPPHRWLMRRRVERAKALLAGDRLSIVEVAQACGFASQSHMTDVFRRFAQGTPAQWRSPR